MITFIILLMCTIMGCEGGFTGHSSILNKLNRHSTSIPTSDFLLPSPEDIVSPPLEVAQYHGTTTLAFVNGNSIIVCVDSKASIGNYVGSRTVKKILPITDSVVATMAGGAADCGYWIREVSKAVKVLEHEQESKLKVQMIARILSTKLREYRGKGLSVGTMVAGIDSLGPSNSDGACVEGSLFCVGSGSSLAYSILDSANIVTDSSSNEENKRGLHTMPIEEAIDNALWAVRHATVRDGYSGGIIQVIQINETGIHLLRRVDCKTLRVNI